MAEAVRNPETRFERSDVPLGLVGYLAAGLAALIIVLPLLLLAIFPDARKDAPRAPSTLPPAPRLQTQPATDLAAHRAREAERLSTYGWVDRARGVVHVPIDKAMKRLAATGIPDWPGAAAPAARSAR